uniref:Uncharacterized protein n=1 Tax=Trichogramma kaykai TaxID=54128 RepID=A0ABD2X8D1_9HYME
MVVIFLFSMSTQENKNCNEYRKPAAGSVSVHRKHPVPTARKILATVFRTDAEHKHPSSLREDPTIFSKALTSDSPRVSFVLPPVWAPVG